MKGVSQFDSVFIHAGHIDFRIRRIGLASYIQNVMGKSIFDGSLFVFRNRASTSVRLVYWDRTGVAMWEKHLEKDRFPWVLERANDAVHVSVDDLQMLLDGVDFTKIRRHQSLHFSRV